MNDVQKVLNWGEAELTVLFRRLPESIKSFDVEMLHVCNIIKAAVASPDAATIEAVLQQLIPGNWEGTVIATVEKALGVAIPTLTNVADAGKAVTQLAYDLVEYLKTLSPKMANSGVLKLLSGLFVAVDPSLTEVEADTAAQLIYAKSVVKAA